MHQIVKRHIAQVNRSYRRYQRKVGTTITWYEIDHANSTMSLIYDEGSEGGSRKWLAGRTVPALSIIRQEDVEHPQDVGLYTGGTIHVTISAHMLELAGISAVHNARKHLDDRFQWNNETWDVRTYQLQGRLIMNEVVIGIDAQRISVEEMFGDVGFPQGPISYAPLALDTWAAHATSTWRQVSGSVL